jgi:hypothetical protein
LAPLPPLPPLVLPLVLPLATPPLVVPLPLLPLLPLVPPVPPVPVLVPLLRVQGEWILLPRHQFPLHRGPDQDAGEQQTLLVLVEEEQDHQVSADAFRETLGDLVQLRQ